MITISHYFLLVYKGAYTWNSHYIIFNTI